jgi:hypothetical protein
MRRPTLLLALILLAGCTHLPWHPYRGWRVWQTPNVAVYTDTITQYEPALEWLDAAYGVYKGTFFNDFTVPPAQVLYLSSDGSSPFLDSSGHFKYGMTIARSPWAEKRGAKSLVVVGYSEWQWSYHHQLAHHFIEAAVPRAPLWFHEGFARYITSFHGVPDRPGVICFGIQQPVFTTQVTLPLGELLAATYHDYNEEKAPWIGPLSQSFIDFLVQAQNGRFRGRFTALMRALASGKSGEQALADVYPEVPLAQMDALFHEHVHTLRPPGQECPVPIALRGEGVAKHQALRAPMEEPDARALVESLELVSEKNGYADFTPAPR